MTDADREKRALDALRRGDRSAMRVLYGLHAARLFRSVLMPLLRDRGTAEDALRDAFLAAMDRAAEFSGESAFAWLATIARNKALDALRALTARERLSDRAAASLGDIPGPETPEQTVAAAEAREKERERIEAVLRDLIPRQAQAIRLRLLEDLSRPECASALGMTLGAFDVLLFRACGAFKTRFVERFGQKP